MEKVLSPLFVFAASILMVILAAGRPALAMEDILFSLKGTQEQKSSLTTLLRERSLLLTLDTKTAPDEEFFAAARADYARLSQALYAEGYYAPIISILINGKEVTDIPVIDIPPLKSVEIIVNPGSVFKFSQAILEPVTQKTALPKGFARGEIAKLAILSDAVAAAIAGWRQNGYAQAKEGAQNITANSKTATLFADIKIDPGQKLRFGKTSVSGNKAVRSKRIMEIAGIPEGDVFSPDKIERAEARLRRSGAFQSVVIIEKPDIVSPDLLETDIEVTEEKPRSISLGGGISTVDGINLLASWSNRNILGGAEKLSLRGELLNVNVPLKSVDRRIGFLFERPATPIPDATMRLSADVAQRSIVSFRGTELNVKYGYSYVIGSEIALKGDLAYQQITGNDLSDTSAIISPRSYHAVTLPLSATYDNRKNKLNPSKERFATAEIKPFIGLGKTGSGVRLYGDIRAYRELSQLLHIKKMQNTVLAGRLQLGAILGGNLFSIPRNDLFLGGGGNTIRGLPYQSLGLSELLNGQNITIGGKRFIVTSLETRTQLTESWGAVTFVDIGRVGLNHFLAGTGNWGAGVGVGVRYLTGVGPIRFDFAIPVHDKTTQQSTTFFGIRAFQIYAGFGQAF